MKTKNDSSSTSKQKTNNVAQKVKIEEAMQAKYIGRYIQVRGTIIEKDRTSYVAKAATEMKCTPTDCTSCRSCEHQVNGYSDVVMGVYDDEILSFINTTKLDIVKLLKEKAGVPSRCGKAKFSKHSKNVNLYQAGIVPCIDFDKTEASSDETSDSGYSVFISAVLMGDLDIQENRDYDYFGVMHQDPKTQRLIFLIDKVEAVADDISSFEMNPVRYKLLSRFQCDPVADTVIAKNEAILKEARVNHHKIFGYRKMEYFVDMVFHSVAGFTFKGTPHYRGWLDGAIIGDSRTGKSEIAQRMMEVHKMGYRISCENVTAAGVLGGLSPSNIKGAQHQLKWGILPRLDRRIVVMDECHNPSVSKLWGKLNDVRSSGVAKISKVGAPDRSAMARVRKLLIANPPNGQTVRDFSSPVEMLQGIFGAPETIARLDFLYVPRTEDSTYRVGEEDEDVMDMYFGEVNKLLLQFIYSRRADQVIFTPEAEEYIIRKAAELGGISDNINIPLLQINEARFTLARGAAAQAARLFSVDKAGDKIIVEKAHAVVYCDTLTANYIHESNDYFKYSHGLVKKIKFENEDEFFAVCCRLRRAVEGDWGLAKTLLEGHETTFKIMTDTTDMDIQKLRTLFKVLVHNDLVIAKATNSSFRKTRRGIACLKYLLALPRIDHIDEDHCKEFFKNLSQ